jgi:hypothetical protein
VLQRTEERELKEHDEPATLSSIASDLLKDGTLSWQAKDCGFDLVTFQRVALAIRAQAAGVPNETESLSGDGDEQALVVDDEHAVVVDDDEVPVHEFEVDDVATSDDERVVSSDEEMEEDD